MQICWWLMEASGIDFQTHKSFLAKLLFAECTSLKCKNAEFLVLPQHCGEKAKTVEIVLGQSQKLFYNQFVQDFAFVLLAVDGGPSFARRLMFSGIDTRAQVSEWI